MSLTQEQVASLAEHLDRAEIERREVTKITDDHPAMTWDDAYAIQDALRARKLARGDAVAGYKAGLTSFAKMAQMGVSEPVFGFLAANGMLSNGGTLDTAGLIHPKVEAEIAFVLKRELKGPGCHIADVLAATDFVLPALEVIDSRYKDFRFDLKSVIADNTSAARWVTGGIAMDVRGLDLEGLSITLERNGKVAAQATGAAVLGHPALSVAMLANMLGRRGQSLPAGAFILTGGATEAVAVQPDDEIRVHYDALGTLSLHVR